MYTTMSQWPNCPRKWYRITHIKERYGLCTQKRQKKKERYGLFRKILNILIILYERPKIETWKLSIRVANASRIF